MAKQEKTQGRKLTQVREEQAWRPGDGSRRDQSTATRDPRSSSQALGSTMSQKDTTGKE